MEDAGVAIVFGGEVVCLGDAFEAQKKAEEELILLEAAKDLTRAAAATGRRRDRAQVRIKIEEGGGGGRGRPRERVKKSEISELSIDVSTAHN